MRKSFRVEVARMAAVFIGAAACALAFGSAAGAATARVTPAAGATTARAAAAAPDITEKNCGANTQNWAHLYLPASAHHGPFCFGFKGSYFLNSFGFTDFCAGNNSGYITDNAGVRYPFSPGENEPMGLGFIVEWVTITGWSGNATCSQ